VLGDREDLGDGAGRALRGVVPGVSGILRRFCFKIDLVFPDSGV
jgi:hypothetical protein